jgi:hypothetical protein
VTEPGTLISELDASSGVVVSTFKLSYGAYELSVDRTNGNLYVTNYHQITSITPGSRGDFPSYDFLEAATAVIIITVAAAVFTTKRRSSTNSNGETQGAQA